MAAKRNPISEKAYEMYVEGMKLVDMAANLQVPPGTVRRWKSTHNWDGERSASKSERSDCQKGKKKQEADDGTKETFQNEELTAEQQLFCVYYARTFNATQSYLKAYASSYDVANAEGYKLLVKPCIKKEIGRLKEIKRKQIVADESDIVELQMRIAFADFGDIARYDEMRVYPRDSRFVDTQLIKKVKETKDGVSIEIEDRQKAINWLTKFFEMNPDDKHRKEFDKRKLELELIRLEMQTKGKEQENESEQDNFLDMLNASAKEVWSEDG